MDVRLLPDTNDTRGGGIVLNMTLPIEQIRGELHGLWLTLTDVRDRVIPLVYTSAAIAVTAFRLYARRRSYGLDDVCAVLALVSMIAQTVALSMIYFGVIRELPPRPSVPTGLTCQFSYLRTKQEQNYRFVSQRHVLLLPRLVRIPNFISTHLNLRISRFARLAMLFSIIRITPYPREARILRGVAVVFLLLLFASIALWVGFCERDTTWKANHIMPICLPDKAIPIFQIIGKLYLFSSSFSLADSIPVCYQLAFFLTRFLSPFPSLSFAN